MRAEAMGVALQDAHSFGLDEKRGCGAALFGDGVPMAHVELANADEVVGEFAGAAMAGNVLDAKLLEAEESSGIESALRPYSSLAFWIRYFRSRNS